MDNKYNEELLIMQVTTEANRQDWDEKIQKLT